MPYDAPLGFPVSACPRETANFAVQFLESLARTHFGRRSGVMRAFVRDRSFEFVEASFGLRSILRDSGNERSWCCHRPVI